LTSVGGCYGSPCTCGPTAPDHAFPAAASQFVDHVIAPRSSGYVREGLNDPQPVPFVRQSSALFTTDGDTYPLPAPLGDAGRPRPTRDGERPPSS